MKNLIINYLILILALNFSLQNAKSQDILIKNNRYYFTSYNGTEASIKEYLKNNIKNLDLIEGIWSQNSSYSINGKMGTVQGNTKYAIIKDKTDNSKFINIVLESTVETYSYAGYKKYDITGEYIKTAYPNVYIANEYATKTEIKNQPHSYNVYVDKDGFLSFSTNFYATPDCYITTNSKDIRLFPTYSDYNTNITTEKPKGSIINGTGFAITQNGYIATCNHVVEGANYIKVKGIRGDFSISYSAKIVSCDVNNDLAIIKIDNIALGTLPSIINTSTIDVGTSIYLLGYPLTATMGEEIKLTSGLISAKSGFKGDITSYQISAPAQPGNSGGPLFDSKGNIAGILNARYSDAENATYAVKSTYLINLIESLSETIPLQTVNSISTKALTEQVKALKNFVYIIEVTKN